MLDTSDVKSLFKKHFASAPTHVVSVPGRVELLGTHTQAQEGIVISAAIHRHIQIASAPRTDGRIELVASAFRAGDQFWLTRLNTNPAAPWADHVKGVLAELRRRGAHFSGFNAAIHGTIPMHAGLGSSAALGLATALTIRELHPYTLTQTGVTVPPRRDSRNRLRPLEKAEKFHLASLCQAAETRFVGVPSGLWDFLPLLFGKAFHTVHIDCRFLSVDVLPLIGETLVLCDSGSRPEAAGSRLLELHRTLDSAARKLQSRTLRSVEPAWLKANRSRLTGPEFAHAYHVIGEIQRAVFSESALRHDDHRQFGQFMSQSHSSGRDYLRHGSPEAELQITLASRDPACLGSRLAGQGFAGATLHLVIHHEVERFMNSIAQSYHHETGRPLTPLLCQITDGIR
ncbi:MAG TPA: galactokinase family protein [Methylomirabilota bacterium]|nr:galactokinase family protein [Methylomirabilota bacterium]